MFELPLPWFVVAHLLGLDRPALDVDPVPYLLVDELADPGAEATSYQLRPVSYLFRLGEVLQGAVPSLHRADRSEPVGRVVLGLGFGGQVQELVKVPFPDELPVAVALGIDPVVVACN